MHRLYSQHTMNNNSFESIVIVGLICPSCLSLPGFVIFSQWPSADFCAYSPFINYHTGNAWFDIFLATLLQSQRLNAKSSISFQCTALAFTCFFFFGVRGCCYCGRYVESLLPSHYFIANLIFAICWVNLLVFVPYVYAAEVLFVVRRTNNLMWTGCIWIHSHHEKVKIIDRTRGVFAFFISFLSFFFLIAFDFVKLSDPSRFASF